jgi:5-methylcytosine-specific restriction protein A
VPRRPTTRRPGSVRPADDRPSASARGYDRRWRQLRTSHLADHPLCVPCSERQLVVQATEVDHRTPHRGDRSLLMDPGNLVSMCKPCHSAKTVREDGGLGRAPTGGGP